MLLMNFNIHVAIVKILILQPTSSYLIVQMHLLKRERREMLIRGEDRQVCFLFNRSQSYL
jgi:hypothetical protein